MCFSGTVWVILIVLYAGIAVGVFFLFVIAIFHPDWVAQSAGGLARTVVDAFKAGYGK